MFKPLYKGKPIERYSMDKIGKVIGEKHVFIWDSFIKDILHLGTLFDYHVIRSEKQTNIECPFCKEGILTLESIEPDYSGGMSSFPSRVLHHTGNSYTLICSKKECSARFFGQYHWMFID
jgi:hypothetical protein